MIMKAFAVALATLALSAAGTQAWANASAASAGGLSLTQPVLSQDAGGARVQGAVCRTGPVPVAGIDGVTIEQLGADGAVTAQAPAHVPASLRVRGAKCAYYNVQTAWTATSPVQVCLAADRGARVCLPAK